MLVSVDWLRIVGPWNPYCTSLSIHPLLALPFQFFDIHLIRAAKRVSRDLLEPSQAFPVQAGSAASLEWIVTWLTNGRPRGCLKTALECACGSTMTTLAVGVKRKPVNWYWAGVWVDHGAAAMGCIYWWFGWKMGRRRPKSSLMDRHRLMAIVSRLCVLMDAMIHDN